MKLYFVAITIFGALTFGSADEDLSQTDLAWLDSNSGSPSNSDSSSISMSHSSSSSNSASLEDSPSEEDDKLSYYYILWIGDDVHTKYKIELKSPPGFRFIHSMHQAAQLDPNYAFEFVKYDFGKLISSIAGVASNPETSQFWFIYVLPSMPKENDPPGDEHLSPVGVDDIEVKDGIHYLFWYKTFNSATHT